MVEKSETALPALFNEYYRLMQMPNAQKSLTKTQKTQEPSKVQDNKSQKVGLA